MACDSATARSIKLLRVKRLGLTPNLSSTLNSVADRTNNAAAVIACSSRRPRSFSASSNTTGHPRFHFQILYRNSISHGRTSRQFNLARYIALEKSFILSMELQLPSVNHFLRGHEPTTARHLSDRDRLIVRLTCKCNTPHDQGSLFAM